MRRISNFFDKQRSWSTRAGGIVAASRFGDRIVCLFTIVELIVLAKLWGVSQVREIVSRHLAGDYGAVANAIVVVALLCLVASIVAMFVETGTRLFFGRPPAAKVHVWIIVGIANCYLLFLVASLARPVATFQLVTAAAALCLFVGFLNAIVIALRRWPWVRWTAFAVLLLTIALNVMRPDHGDVVALIESPAADGLSTFYKVFDFAKLADAPGYRCTEENFPKQYGPDLESAFQTANSMRDIDYAGLKPATFLADFRCLYFLRVAGPHGRWPEIRKSFSLWLASRPDREAYAKAGRRYPVFLVSAQGGGIYAAAHVSLFLARLQDACPSFAQHVFVISAVSGGSIGATTFSNSVASDAPVTTMGCATPAANGSHEAQVAKFLESDFLTPVVDSMLGPNLINGLLTTRVQAWHRADILERYFEQTWLDQNGGRDLWAEGVAGSWKPDAVNPALLFNVTEVSTGRRTIIAPFGAKAEGDFDFPDFDRRLADQIFTDDNFYRRGLRVGTAAVMSARFPFVTPPASIPIGVPDPGNPKNFVATQFVDGGYADNSGAETLSEVVKLLSSEPEDVDLHVLSFADSDDFRANVKSDPKYNPNYDIPYFYLTTDPSSRPFNGEWSGPIVAFAQARAAHAEAAIRSLQAEMSPDCQMLTNVRCYASPAFMRVPIDTKSLGLPLGWTLSRDSLNRIRRSLWAFSRCSIKMPTDGFRESPYIRKWLEPYNDTAKGVILKAVAHDEANLMDAEETRRQGDPGLVPSDLDAFGSEPDCAMVKIQQILSGSLARLRTTLRR